MSEELVSLFGFFATSIGSGLAAQWLFTKAREAYPAPRTAPTSPIVAYLYRCLYAPRYARYSVLALAVLIGSLSSGAVALLTGADVDTLASAMLAPVVSQIAHANRYLSDRVGE